MKPFASLLIVSLLPPTSVPAPPPPPAPRKRCLLRAPTALAPGFPARGRGRGLQISWRFLRRLRLCSQEGEGQVSWCRAPQGPTMSNSSMRWKSHSTKTPPAPKTRSAQLEKHGSWSLLLPLSLSSANFPLPFATRHAASHLISRLNGHSAVIKLLSGATGGEPVSVTDRVPQPSRSPPRAARAPNSEFSRQRVRAVRFVFSAVRGQRPADLKSWRPVCSVTSWESDWVGSDFQSHDDPLKPGEIHLARCQW